MHKKVILYSIELFHFQSSLLYILWIDEGDYRQGVVTMINDDDL